MRSISGILILFTLTFFISCGGESQPQTTLPQGESATPDVTEVSASELFFENLSSLCGESFTGESVFRSEEHTSELQSRGHLVCRLLLEKKNKKSTIT